MADSPILKIPLLSVSQANKEQTINTMVSYLERSMNDAQTINLGPSNFVITSTDFARFFMWRLTGVASGRTITLPAQKRLFVMENLTGAFTVDLVRGASVLTIPVGGVLVVYCDGTNLISVADSTVMGGGGGAVTAFVSLIDTFASYAGQAGKLVRVKATEDGLEPSELTLTELSDVDTTGIADGYTIIWDAATATWLVAATGGSPTSNTVAIKNPVDVATDLPVSLNDDLIIGGTVDGILLSLGMRVLVKDQAVTEDNGIYVVTNTTPVRASDANDVGEFTEGSLIYIRQGIANGDKLFVQTEPDPPGGITPGASPLTFALLPIGNLQSLGDVDVSTVADGDALVWNAATSKWEPGSPGASYPPMAGNAGKFLAVNNTEDGVEWATGGGGASGVPVLSAFISGKLLVDEILFRWVVPEGVTYTLPIGLAGSKFTTRVASTTTVVLKIIADGIEVGTITFASSSTGVVSFTSAVVLTENSTLSVVGGPTPDENLADLSMTFKGV